MKDEKISLKEGLKINRRGLKMIYSLIPWNNNWNVAYAIVNVLFYYWDFVFLAIVVDHIVADAAFDILVRDIAVMLGGKIIIHIANRFVQYYLFYCGSNVWEIANAELNRKIMDMDYEYMESESIHNLRRDIDAMARNNGSGINRLFWNSFSVIEKLFHITIALGYTIYIMYQGKNAFPDNPAKYMLFFVSFLGLLIFLMSLTVKLERNADITRFKKIEENLPLIRKFNFYSEEYINREECGKNIRMFHQQGLLYAHMKKNNRFIVPY